MPSATIIWTRISCSLSGIHTSMQPQHNSIFPASIPNWFCVWVWSGNVLTVCHHSTSYGFTYMLFWNRAVLPVYWTIPGCSILCWFLILNKSKWYCHTPNISHTLVGNKFVDHSVLVGWSPVGAAPTTALLPRKAVKFNHSLNITPGFNGLGKDNCRTRWETMKYLDLAWLILQVWLLLYDPLLLLSPLTHCALVMHAICQHRSGSTLAQVMAYCLMALSHDLNKCWILISGDIYTHLRPLSQEVLMIPVHKTSLKSTL